MLSLGQLLYGTHLGESQTECRLISLPERAAVRLVVPGRMSLRYWKVILRKL